MGDKRNKKEKRDQRISNTGMNMKDEVELEQTKAILSAAGARNVDTITIEGSTTRADETYLNSESESTKYTGNIWEPKLSFSQSELEAQQRAKNRLRRRVVIA